MDAYNEEEQNEAWVVALEENLALPAQALVVGEFVTVLGFEREALGEVLAKCRRGSRVYRINATALEWTGDVVPAGSDWLEAYRAWLRRA